LKITSNALVTLVRAEQDCFKELFEAVDITRQISEFIWQWVPDRRVMFGSDYKFNALPVAQPALYSVDF